MAATSRGVAAFFLLYFYMKKAATPESVGRRFGVSVMIAFAVLCSSIIDITPTNTKRRNWHYRKFSELDFCEPSIPNDELVAEYSFLSIDPALQQFYGTNVQPI